MPLGTPWSRLFPSVSASLTSSLTTTRYATSRQACDSEGQTEARSTCTLAQHSTEFTFASSATLASQSKDDVLGSWCLPQPGTNTPGAKARDVSWSPQSILARGVLVVGRCFFPPRLRFVPCCNSAVVKRMSRALERGIRGRGHDPRRTITASVRDAP